MAVRAWHTRVSLGREYDASVREELLALLDAVGPDAVIDLADVVFMDAASVDAIRSFPRHMLVNVPPQIQRVLQLLDARG